MKTSIIITSYNYESFIAKSIESVINQTLPDWELIIVDDGSRDNSLNIIKSFCEKDPRIKLLTHENNANLGMKSSLYAGINAAQNEWIAFLESDDYWSPNYLEEKTKIINEQPDCAFIYNNVECFGDKNRIKDFESYFKFLDDVWKDCNIKDVFDEFGIRNIVPTFSCVMCTKAELLKCNPNTPSAPALDYWLWWQIAEKNQFYFLNKKLTFWQFHPESYLSQHSKSLKYYLERGVFVYEFLKITKRKPNLHGRNVLKQYPLVSVPWHIYKYLTRKKLRFIKDLFKKTV